MTLTIQELTEIFSCLLTKLQNEDVLDIEIDSDFYRYIPADQWNNYVDDVIVTGSLHDDIESLKLLLLDVNRPCTYVDFDRLASVLRAISQTMNPI